MFSRSYPNESFKSTPCPSSEYRILTPNSFNKDKVHLKEDNFSFRASEKIHFIESNNQNGTRYSLIERSICLEMNKTELLRESGE